MHDATESMETTRYAQSASSPFFIIIADITFLI